MGECGKERRSRDEVAREFLVLDVQKLASGDFARR